ncbi:hypothetical protein HET73_03800 [Wolbachia endosymbiont of Atemnus politus]|uniref:hypothetical protein n=1 Tax=Wolbachia endosymbiont of Atemnus politus TaxID=2682840 RepID=UPI001573C77E|nr:hypothetical protein [Wolbachia endosymbiont of Atemnus politus]NSM56603.1 hypothetical protein [Wolbachia endosymbiont of Atemnus politus]
MSEEDNTNNKNESQSVVGRILSVPRNLLVNISNFISGANKSANDEPQWYKNLRKSETMDGGVLPTMFNEESNNTIGANDPAPNCKVTRGSNKHTAKNETSTP